MSIILLLLKIIGIILLSVLGILILLILLVLFVPAHYSAEGTIGEQNGIQGKIHWLFHILTFSFAYKDGGFDYSLRIFGIKKRIRKNNMEMDEEDWEEDSQPSKESEAMPDGKTDRTWEQEKDPQEREQQDFSRARLRLPKQQKSLDSPRENPYQKLKRRMGEFYQRIELLVQKILYMVTHIREQVSDIKKMIMDEMNKKSVLNILKELKYLLKHFRFRKIYTDLAFSIGDPALTGQALGVLCMIPAMYRFDLHVYPDFDSEDFYVKGSFLLKGYARMTHILISLIRLFSGKEFRTFVKRIMK